MLGQQSPSRSPRRLTPSEALELSDALSGAQRLAQPYAIAAAGVAADYAARCTRDLMAGDLWSALRAASLAVEADRIAARETAFAARVQGERVRADELQRPRQLKRGGQPVVEQDPAARGAQ